MGIVVQLNHGIMLTHGDLRIKHLDIMGYMATTSATSRV